MFLLRFSLTGNLSNTIWDYHDNYIWDSTDDFYKDLNVYIHQERIDKTLDLYNYLLSDLSMSNTSIGSVMDNPYVSRDVLNEIHS